MHRRTFLTVVAGATVGTAFPLPALASGVCATCGAATDVHLIWFTRLTQHNRRTGRTEFGHRLPGQAVIQTMLAHAFLRKNLRQRWGSWSLDRLQCINVISQ